MQKLCKAKKILLIGLSVFAVSLCGMDHNLLGIVGQENKQNLDPYNSFLPTIVDNTDPNLNVQQVATELTKEEKRRSGSRPASRSHSPQRFMEKVEEKVEHFIDDISEKADQFLRPASGYVSNLNSLQAGAEVVSSSTDHSKIHEKVKDHKKRNSQKREKAEQLANQAKPAKTQAKDTAVEHADSNIASGLGSDAFQVLPISPEVKEQVDEAMGVISHLDKALERNAGHKSKTNANDLLQQAEALKHTSEQKHIVEQPIVTPVKTPEENKVNATGGTQEVMQLIVRPTLRIYKAPKDERDASDAWHIAKGDFVVLCNVTDSTGQLARKEFAHVPLSVLLHRISREVKSDYLYKPEITDDEIMLLRLDASNLREQAKGMDDQGRRLLVPDRKTIFKAPECFQSSVDECSYAKEEIVVECPVGGSERLIVPVDFFLLSKVAKFENGNEFTSRLTRLQRNELETRKKELEEEQNLTTDEKSNGGNSKTTQPLIQPGASKTDTNQSKQPRWSMLYSKPVVFGVVVVGVLSCFSWLYANNRLSERLQSHCESFLNVFRTFYNAF
jgi:hypothetical protein